MKPIQKYLLIVLILGITSFQVSAGSEKKMGDSAVVENEIKPMFDFFGSDEILEITLQFNMRNFIKARLEPDKNFEARLTVVTPDKQTLTQDIKMRARGKMRRKFCTFPPIMLKMKKCQDQEQVFPKGNIKLVTHCSQAANFENYLMKEYLAYKLYNVITPYSLRTRLVIVNYVDSLNPKRSIREYGFLIENEKELAARNNAIIIENLKIGQNHMDNYEMTRVALFNYMIGNTDWSVAEQHNVKVLKIDEPTSEKGIPVTYDFDYSGFVNTTYSSPNDQIPITHVTERYFQGGCYSDEVFRKVIEEFENLKPELMKTIEEFPYMQNGQKKLAASFINSFFKKYKREDALIADINRTCLRMN